MSAGCGAAYLQGMNKAFVRDPEPRDPSCPEPRGCGATGLPVEEVTLGAQLSQDARRALQAQAFYCPNPACGIAYFDAWGGTVTLDRVEQPAYPKPVSSPLCNCLGIRADEIIEDAERGSRDRIRRLLTESQSGTLPCAKRMPSGRPCVTEARKLFMAHFRSPNPE